jgi:sugar phosphate isomerase/epimerase
MVTYMWGAAWDVDTLLAHCSAAKILGVELRTGHAHKVEPNLTAPQRAEVKKRFADSPVTLVGIGSAEEYHHTDPARLKKAIEDTKAFVKLSHDVGGSGVKVRPNDLPKGVPQEKTIEQIGKSLNAVGAFAADYGQQIRLEVHGGCARLPILKRILDVADHPNVFVCWNSNQSDLEGGLESNFDLVKKRFGATVHVRPLDTPGYPWAELVGLFVKMNYRGWLLLEAGGSAKDPVKDLVRQRDLFERMRDAAASGETFTRLFDGKSFDGWEGNLKMFRIEDAAIVGGTLKEKVPHNDFLCTKKQYGDFELRLSFKTLGKGVNAGVQVRSQRVPNHFEVSGYQADLGDGYWGCLYDESRRNKTLAGPPAEDRGKPVKQGEWNRYVIRCQGPRIQLWINGTQTVDYVEKDPAIPRTGILGLQIHGGDPSEAWYKDIEICELGPAK